MITHQEIDAKSLAMTRRVVAKIRANPSLFEQVKAALKHQQEIGSPNSRPYRDKWQSLVDQGMEACLCAAVDESEQGKAMRQASPFTRILTNAERLAFLRAWMDARPDFLYPSPEAKLQSIAHWAATFPDAGVPTNEDRLACLTALRDLFPEAY